MGGIPSRSLVVLGIATLLAAALAGCLGGGQGSDAAEDVTLEDLQSLSIELGNDSAEVELPLLSAPRGLDLYFTAAGGLANATPEAGSVDLPGGFSSLALEFQTAAFAGEPLPQAVVILAEPVSVRFFVTADVSMVGNGGSEFAVWAGSTRGMALFAFVPLGAPALLPGEVRAVEVTFEFGSLRPLVVPAGERLQVLLFSAMVPADAPGQMHVLVGGDTPSGANLTLSAFSRDPLAGLGLVEETSFTGAVSNNQPVTCGVQEGVSHQVHDLPVKEGATYLEIRLTGSHLSPTIVDLDLALFDGSERIAGTGSPYADEAILLVGPTMEGLADKTLTLQVYACFGLNAEYEAVVQQA